MIITPVQWKTTTIRTKITMLKVDHNTENMYISMVFGYTDKRMTTEQYLIYCLKK